MKSLDLLQFGCQENIITVSAETNFELFENFTLKLEEFLEELKEGAVEAGLNLKYSVDKSQPYKVSVITEDIIMAKRFSVIIQLFMNKYLAREFKPNVSNKAKSLLIHISEKLAQSINIINELNYCAGELYQKEPSKENAELKEMLQVQLENAKQCILTYRIKTGVYFT